MFSPMISTCQVAAPHSQFVDAWIESYMSYIPNNWSWNSVLMANKLSEIFPHLIHIEETSFNHPIWSHPRQLYIFHYNYTNNYSVHMFYKDKHYIPRNVDELAGYNCTLGDIMREVLYGNPKLRSNATTNGHTKRKRH